MNDIEPAWKALKQTELAHLTFQDDGVLKKAIQMACGTGIAKRTSIRGEM
ncbi:hypothetical protein [Paracoccus ravus]|nr:hypothetical protein [Paracoccus ravus]